VDVVDRQHQWPVVGDVRDEPVERVEVGERVVAGDVDRTRAEKRCGARGRAVEPCRAPVGGGAREQGLEELAHHHERKLPIELRGARAEHLHAAVARPRPRTLDQARLADAGRALDEQHPTAARERLLEQVADQAELASAFEQLHAQIVYMPYGPRAPHREKFGVWVQGDPRCGRPIWAESCTAMTAGEQPRRLGLEVRFDREPIEGQLYDRDDEARIARPFAGWLGLMSAIEDARNAEADDREGER
jgi:hypothetical protein